MTVSSPITQALAAPPPASREATTPEEAARQFEAVLTRQFVEIMTKDLFDKEAEGMLSGQADLQKDALTDALTEHLTDSGTLGIAELLLAQWDRQPVDPAELEAAALKPASLVDAEGTALSPSREMTMDEALRLYAPAERTARPLDPPQ